MTADRLRSTGHDVGLPGPGPGTWEWPWWLRRQVDPASPAWLPADLAGRNRTGRSWTVIGVPEGADRWVVDRRGLLAPSSGRWALDWWVGSDDRWRLPAAEPSTRQGLLDAAPVVETRMRVPGGEVVARHWGTPAGEGDAVVMEVGNAASGPVAVAVVLRPVGPAGATGARRAVLEGGRLTVDGVTILESAVAPRHAAVSTGPEGDVAATVLANATASARALEADCALGWVGVAMVWPLARGAALRVEIPGATRRRRRPAGDPTVRPGPVDTARGWAARTGRTARLELPEGPLASALAAQRGHLLLAGTDGPDVSRPAAAQIVGALATAGLREEAGVRLDAWLAEQHRSGRLGDDAAATGASLWALERWARTGGDDGLLARSPLTLARSVEYLARHGDAGSPLAATWVCTGLAAAARLLAALGEDEAAAAAWRWAGARVTTLAERLSAAVGAVGSGAGEAVEASLLAVVNGLVPPLGPLAVAARRVAGAVVPGLPAGAVPGVPPLLGLRPDLALLAAAATVVAAGDPGPALEWVLGIASPTWTWPSVASPRLGTGSHGSGHDPLVAARLWSCGRSMLVTDPVPAGPTAGAGPIELLPAFPTAWLGLGVEVHGLPTAAGRLSYALRWHGDRPAILWEVDGDGAPPLMSTPGLDPAWRGAGRRGEALLSPVVIPPPDGPGPAGAADGPSLT